MQNNNGEAPDIVAEISKAIRRVINHGPALLALRDALSQMSAACDARAGVLQAIVAEDDEMAEFDRKRFKMSIKRAHRALDSPATRMLESTSTDPAGEHGAGGSIADCPFIGGSGRL